MSRAHLLYRPEKSKIMEVTSLPVNPYNGMEIDYIADAEDNIIWRLRYRAAIIDAYKWVFMGGAPLYDEMDSSVALNTTGAFTDYSDSGPQIVLPYAGNYFCSWGGRVSHSGSGQGVQIALAATGLTPSGAGDPMFVQPAAANSSAASVSRSRVYNGISGTLKHQYFIGLAGGESARRWTSVQPIRVGS